MKTKKILDKGYVKLIETWGSDRAIIEAARMSTNKGFLGWDKDEKLLAFLYNHKHSTPFEMAGMVIEVKAPIFVFREWHRHRTQSYNEMSARYVPLPDENYLPDVRNVLERVTKATSNKQAQSAGGKVPNAEEIIEWREELWRFYNKAQEMYERGIDMGIPKELARLAVPVARYSRMRASANLRNWLAFMTLRSAPNAQWEIQQYSHAVGEIVAEKFPKTWALFEAEQKR
jgi:thymidylate synthase (FAD)